MSDGGGLPERRGVHDQGLVTHYVLYFDIWLTLDGAYLYQIYGNASKLVGYAVQPDGSVDEITSTSIPYNSPEGLMGFCVRREAPVRRVQ